MLIPRFSIRLLLLITTCCAVFFSIASLAIYGRDWAIAISTAVCALGVVLALHVLVFAFAWLLASTQSAIRGGRQTGSPFATAAPPQQVIPPPPPTD